MSSAIRFAIVSFLGGITCGLVGHYTQPDSSIPVVVMVSFLYSFGCWMAIMIENEK